MLALRILSLPLAMAAFAVLYVVATKAPEAVEVGSLLLWMLLPTVLIAKVARRIWK
ncbi:MAG: hypothetical protein KGI75_11700 [Rhizobiaceae bacterium]|nr:hypothetical protein [Rhizobiaceae bacterium]